MDASAWYRKPWTIATTGITSKEPFDSANTRGVTAQRSGGEFPGRPPQRFDIRQATQPTQSK